MCAVVCLASGVDALYLSGSAMISPDLVALLMSERERATVLRGTTSHTLCVGAQEFVVGWGNWHNYRIRLDAPGKALVGLVPSGENFPALRVEPRARFLHAVGPVGVLAWVYEVFEALGVEAEWKVSRLDLFADFQGLRLSAESRWDFVCKGKRRRTFEDGDDLETLYFGSGKPVMARVYDKTKESTAKGTDWWPAIWGDAYRRGEQVWRIEFQIERAYLKDVRLSSPEETLMAASRLWEKLAGEWLTLRTPTEDSNRSRWPLAPEWAVVQAVEVNGPAVGPELVREGQRRGDLRKLAPLAVGSLSSLAALTGARDEAELLELLPRFLARDARIRGVRFADRIADKRREYGAA